MNVVMCRALGSINSIVLKTRALLCPEGQWLIMKGHYPQDELSEISYPFVVHRLQVPGLEAERHLVEILNR